MATENTTLEERNPCRAQIKDMLACIYQVTHSKECTVMSIHSAVDRLLHVHGLKRDDILFLETGDTKYISGQ